MTRDYRQEQHLIAALVGGRHERLYQTSATFKAQMDVLASMLPAWADGIAAGAVAADEAMERAVRASLSAPLFLNNPTLEASVR